MDFALGDMGMKEFNKGCEIWFWTRSMHKKAKKEKKKALQVRGKDEHQVEE